MSKGNEAVKDEIQQVFKKYSAKELKIQEIKKNDEKTYDLNKLHQLDSIPTDTTTIKNFFLNGGFLNLEEINDFNSMRKESVKSPSRPATYLTICDIRETATNDYEKAIFTTTFLDPFKKTELGKIAFQTVDTDSTLQKTYKLCCKIHTQNIETIKIDEQNKQLDEQNKQLDEQNKQLDEQNKQLDEQNKQLDEQNKQLDELLKLLDQMEAIYKQYLDK